MGKELVIIHYHLRPGGVRRVIELGAPKIVLKLGIDKVTIATGEAPTDDWFDIFKSRIGKCAFNSFIRPSFGYISDQNCSIIESKKTISKDVEDLFKTLQNKDAIIWFHNPGLGRNIVLTDKIFRKSAECGVPVIAHHHDWWFENRWQRLSEMIQIGYDSLEKIAYACLNPSPNIKHCAINFFDYSILKKYFPNATGWLPNPVEFGFSPNETAIDKARQWLIKVLNDTSPVWIMPCRILRRKNIAEALLIKEWINQDASLVVTAKPSSADEIGYADAISAFCENNKIKFKSGLLAEHTHENPPDIYSLIAASEAVLLTSLQEGFGLTYIEAALTKTPLIARMLPNLKEDFKQFGLKFPHNYDDILVHPDLFDWKEESRRQKKIYENWVKKLPADFRKWVVLPEIANRPELPKPIQFSKLTLQAQLEVLSNPASYSFEKCMDLNPFIKKLKRIGNSNTLKPVELSPSTLAILSVDRYADNFLKLLKTGAVSSTAKPTSNRLQNEFIRKKLSPQFIYPLLIEHLGEMHESQSNNI